MADETQADEMQYLEKRAETLSGQVHGLNILVAAMMRLLVRNNEDRLFLQQALEQMFAEIEETMENDPTASTITMRAGMRAIKEQGLGILRNMPMFDASYSKFPAEHGATPTMVHGTGQHRR